MEMLVIAVVAVAAFTAVLVPLFRRRPGYGDEREFENIPPANPGQAAPPSQVDTTKREAAPPAASLRPAAQPTTPAAEPTTPAAEQTTPAAEPTTPAAEQTTQAAPDADSTDDALELEVQRYRAAVRADTVCGKCGQANPADSTFCFECGAGLPRADAREFE